MKLSDVIFAETILENLGSPSRKKALEKLVKQLAAVGKCSDVEKAMENVMARESVGSTFVGSGVAVPHARTLAVDELVCAMGRSANGVNFGEGHRAQLVFLVLYPNQQTTRYLWFLSALSHVLLNEEVRAQLVKAKGQDEIMAVLAAADEALVHEQEGRTAGDGGKEKKPKLKFAGHRWELHLLIRLQWLEELAADEETKPEDRQELAGRIGRLRESISPSLTSHYDRLRRRKGTGLAAMDGGVCQGCQMLLSSHQQQKVLTSTSEIFRCPTCLRFLYAI